MLADSAASNGKYARGDSSGVISEITAILLPFLNSLNKAIDHSLNSWSMHPPITEDLCRFFLSSKMVIKV